MRPSIHALLQAQQKAPQSQRVPTEVRLDANESPWGNPLNRYPAADQMKWREIAGQVKGRLRPQCVALCNGTLEAVDMLIRVSCVPQRDHIVTVVPTTPLFERQARINDVECRTVPLDTDYALSAERLLERVSGRTRLVCLCSPNTPTGNLLSRKEILRICEEFSGLVIVDESYVGFSGHRSLVSDLPAHSNLVLLESLSATYALAGLRVAMIYAHPDVIRAVEVVRPPHNINLPALDIIAQLPVRRFEADKWVKLLTDERSKVMRAVAELSICEKVFPTSANFFLMKVKDSSSVHAYLLENGIAVRDCSAIPGCRDCLRITIGHPHENNLLIGALRRYASEPHP